MPHPLLSTKLFVPPPRPTLVPRPRLVERLSQGLVFRYPDLCPGWIWEDHAGQRVARLECRTRLPARMLSLETDDNDLTRFLTYLVAALGMLQSPQPPPVQAFLTGLINDLGELDHSFALVLDNYHVINATPVHEAFGFLLDHLPRHMHLVIITLADPPLPLARMRARDQQAPNLCGRVYSRRKGTPRLSSSHCARRKNWRGDRE